MAYSRRLTILSTREINVYFSRPQFTDPDRRHFFTLSEGAHQQMKMLRTTSSKCFFIVQYGYLKAKKQFFPITFKEISDDLKIICECYQLGWPTKDVSKDTQRKIQQMILAHENYQADTKVINQQLIAESKQLVSQCTTPRELFDALLIFLSAQKYIVPAYSHLQTIIGQAFKTENDRLQALLKKHLPQSAVKLLKQLLSTEKNYYEITRLQQDQKNFNYTQNQRIIEYKRNYQSLYLTAKRIIPKLKLIHKKVDYYASLANHYPVSKMKKLKSHITALYLLCYMFNRSRKFNDDLMNAFVYYVDKYQKAAKEYGKQKIYEAKSDLHQLAQRKLPKVLQLFIDDSIIEKNIRQKSFKLIPKEKFPSLIQYLSGLKLDEVNFRWEFFEEKHAEIIKNLRSLFMALDFDCPLRLSTLNDAIVFVQQQFAKKSPLSNVSLQEVPLEFLPKSFKAYIYTCDDAGKIVDINLSRYEFSVYLMIRKEFKKNNVAICDSIKNKRLEDDLIPKHKKNAIIKKINNPLLSTSFHKTLDADKHTLDTLYHHVNQRLENGENKSVKIERQDNHVRFSLLYNKKEDLANHEFFLKIPQTNIISLLNFVHYKTGFLGKFTHIKPHYAKAKQDNQLIIAVNIANGTHQGTYKLAHNSNVDYQSLLNTERNFIRLETLKLANDCLSHYISMLPIFSEWNLQSNVHYGAVDGQKFQTRIETLQARHSAKYFPLKKGIVAYTLLSNHIPLSTEIISPNLHESYFLFDIIKNMTADVPLDVVSGDSHVINPVNFFLMRYLPVQFAPHLVHINNKIKNLTAFAHQSTFRDYLLKPHHRVDTECILNEESNIQWIVASLLQGDTAQNIMVRKLSATAGHHQTCMAMSEYNRVFESIYTLNYIDNPELRKYVRGSLNRVEAYHQMRRAIAFANNGEFRGNSENELAIWNESARLLANAFIYYNACLLTVPSQQLN